MVGTSLARCHAGSSPLLALCRMAASPSFPPRFTGLHVDPLVATELPGVSRPLASGPRDEPQGLTERRANPLDHRDRRTNLAGSCSGNSLVWSHVVAFGS